MNFVEACRKGAGWPSLHRDAPIRPDGKKVWSITQDDVAAFVGQVRSRSQDLQDDLLAKEQRIAKLSDEKAALSATVNLLRTQLDRFESARKVKARAESMGLDDAQCRQLADSVSTQTVESEKRLKAS